MDSRTNDTDTSTPARKKLSRRATLLITILVVAFGVRMLAATYWHRQALAENRVLRLGDSDSYWVLAGHLARGEPYQYGSPDASIFRAPLYPLALALFTWIESKSDAVYWARIFGCLSGTLTVWLVMRLSYRIEQSMLAECVNVDHAPNDHLPRSLSDSNAALLAGALTALYPGAIGMSIVILSEAIFCPLMLLTLIGWHRAVVADRIRPIWIVCLLAGAASGLAILARPSWLLFMPLAGSVTLLFSRRRLHQLIALTLMAVGCVGVMSPWWIRNYQITHRLVPTTLQVGPSLYDGLHPGASGGSDENMDFVNEFIDRQRRLDSENGLSRQPDSQQLSAHSTFEYRLNASMNRAAVEWASKNISVAIRLALVKFRRTWSLWPSAGEVGSTVLRAALSLSCFGILGLAVWASWIGIQRHDRNWTTSLALCWGPALYFTWLHMVFVGSIRYREPAMLVLSALAACSLHYALSQRDKKDKNKN